MKKLLLIITTLVVVLFLASCTATSTNTTGSTDTTQTAEQAAAALSLAQCLTDSGAKFYGAYWCPHCIEQKEQFGAAISSVPYIECEDDPNQCAAAGITGYPTWIFADGTVVQGAQSFEALASYSGCEY